MEVPIIEQLAWTPYPGREPHSSFQRLIACSSRRAPIRASPRRSGFFVRHHDFGGALYGGWAMSAPFKSCQSSRQHRLPDAEAPTNNEARAPRSGIEATARGAIVIYFGRLGGWLRPHQRAMLAVNAKAIARIKQHEFAGIYEAE